MRFRWIKKAAALLIGALLFAGCAEEAPTAPGTGGAPDLPDAAWLAFDTGFFEGEEKALDGSHAHFLNAAIRVAALSAITEIALAPPVAAFALAVHTVPSRQPDDSYLWVYTYVMGEEEVQVRLRGKDTGNGAEWALRVTALHLDPPVADELWFEGETRRGGREGVLRFYDWNLPGKPKTGTLEWENERTYEDLRFTDHEENPGDVLRFLADAAESRIDYHDDSEDADWFILWRETDGTGSLKVEEYNGGEKACWDEDQEDCACALAQ